MSNVLKDITGFDDETIRVVVLNGKRVKIIECPVKEGKAYFTKQISIRFTPNDIGAVFVRSRRPPFRKEYRQCILWRAGQDSAISGQQAKAVLDPNTEVTLDCENWGNKDDFMPPLTQEENARFIERLVLEAMARNKKLTTNQFAVLCVLIGIAIAVGVMNLAGVHLSLSSGQQAIVNATVTATPKVFP